MGQLRLTCFGAFEVTLNDTRLTTFPTEKVRALLVYLALERQAHQRSALAQLLWPGYTAESANTSLRQTLRRLRQLLGDDEEAPGDTPWLLVTRQTVQFNPAADLSTDVITFSELLAACAAHPHSHITTCQPCLARLRQAVDLYRGDFLSGFTVADSDSFEEWRRITQEQFHLQTLDALTHLATAAENADDDEAALQAAQRQLALEPWLEAAHRCVMRVLARRGQRAAALAQYNRCCQVLAEEFGGAPDGETLALVAQIERGEFDKKTGRQDDKMNLSSGGSLPGAVILSSGHLVTEALGFPIPHNLPDALIPCIGREREIAEILARLQQPDVRLLTLVGAGGMGKTRLALAVGHQILDSTTPRAETTPIANRQSLFWKEPKFPDGIFFVALAPLTSADALVPTLFSTLGLEVQGDLYERLLQYLRNKQLLLILDNCEHLLAVSGLVATWLRAAPGLQILATSREPLNVRSEVRYPVYGLDYGPRGQADPAAPAAAVEMFLQSVERASGTGRQGLEMAAVLRICQFVHGMPLGLEMAAAWTTMLSVAEIAAEIEKSVDFLTLDWQDAPDRQRSMRALFEWSWRLLSKAEEQLLGQFALFAGSFTRTAAEQITGASLRVLTSLLAKSLVHEAQGREAATRRYELHPLLRQFAAEHLNATNTRPATERRYSHFYLTFVASQQARLLGNEMRAAADEMRAEFDHIRQAWLWAIQQQQWEQIEAAAYSLSEYFLLAGLTAEGEQSFQLAADACERSLVGQPQEAPATQARQRTLSLLLALVALGRYRQSKFDAVASVAQQTITLAVACGAQEAQVQAWYAWAMSLSEQGHFAQAEAYLNNVKTLLEQAEHGGETSPMLADFWWRYFLGKFYHAGMQGQFATALPYGATGLAYAQQVGSLRGQITIRLNLSDLYLDCEDYAQARQEAELSLALARSMSYHWGEAGALKTLGSAHHALGDYRLAIQAYEQARAIAQEIGDSRQEVELGAALCQLYTLLGNRDRAAEFLPTEAESTVARTAVLTQFMILMATALYHQVAEQHAQASQAASRAWLVAGEANNPRMRAQAAVYQGHAQAGMQQWDAAAEHYRQAVQLFAELNQPAQAIEAQAALAQIALAQGDRAGANTQIDAILPILAAEAHIGDNNPSFIYLTSYRVLAANQDQRAATFLHQGYTLLQQAAAALDDESRLRFLTAVPSHRDLVAAYEAQGTRHETRDTRQNNTETEGAEAKVLEESRVSLSRVSLPPSLPVFSSPLVGRARALVEISNQLRLPGVRLLTLMGPGGMGKTRLAVEVGRDHLTTFVDGVYFVQLAAINTPGVMAPTIIKALGLPLQGGDPHAALLHALQQKQLLLILDNFEHLLDDEAAIELVVEILAAAPGVQMLVTSRERLNLREEQLYPVQALALAANDNFTEATASAAARLFVQAAQRHKADFQLTAANCAAVLRICRLVQGMPLGLELAAANVGILPLPEIADEIAQSTEFLAVDWRDMPQRQRSMRAVFDWSWRLLNQQERAVFRQLAIFQGGFTRLAATQIAGATLPVLTRLLHKSLLYTPEPTAADGRYQIHELLRQFAAVELTNAQEEAATADRHSTYYLSLLAAQQQPIMHDAPRDGVQAIQRELDNIRQAWRWGAGHLPAALVEQSALALREFYWLTGLTTEAIDLFTLAAQARRRQQHQQRDALTTPDQPLDPTAEARLYSLLTGLAGAFHISVGRHEEALQSAAETLQVADALVNPAGAALGYMVQGQALRRLGQSAEALRLLTQCVTLAREARNRVPHPSLLLDIERRAYSWLVSIALSNDDYAAAKAYSLYQLDICQEFQLRVGEAAALTCLIEINHAFGDYAVARQQAEQALATSQQTDFLWGQAICSEHLATIAWAQGDYHGAQRYYEQALALYRLMNRTLEESTITHMLGRLYLRLGDVTHARSQIDQAFTLLQSINLPARETFWATSSRARLGYLTNDLTRALVDAEGALKMARQLDGGASQADALVLLGLVREALHQSAAAATAYREAVTVYVTLGHHHRAAEPRAGLARLALAAGAPANAMAEVEEILTILQSHPLAGFDEPFGVYLTCHRVLAANHDPRAAALIATAHELLVTYATRIPDQPVRRAFLEEVVTHRAVQQAFATAQEQGDKTTGDKVTGDKVTGDKVTGHKVTGDKVTESPSHGAPPKPTPSPLHDWGEMPAVDFFTGRAAELAQVTAWLAPVDSAPPARLVSILGLGGMGKTTLAAAATKAVAPRFAVVIWRSLLNAPPLGELLGNWLQVLARQQLTALPTTLDEQLRLLLDYLRQERCLLVLDNVESIFGANETPGRAGSTRPGYEGYDQLFQRIGGSEHQSCLLLTSREQPYALLRLGRQAQEQAPSGRGRIRVLALTGLDQQAGQALLQSNGLHTSAQEAAQLIDNYSGNPLALQIVAATIADFFGGDVAAFQQEEGVLFDGMRVVLDQQFARLSPLEREILLWLAIEREAVTVPTLRSNFVQPVTTREFLEALQALQNRSLLETHTTGLTLQNVIIEYATTYLVEQLYQEIYEFGVTNYKLRTSVLDKEHAGSPGACNPRDPLGRSFLNRFAFLKTQAKEYVRQSQVRLIVQPLVERLVTTLGKAELIARIPHLLDRLRAAPVRTGYAAGNLLNVLVHLEASLTDLDCSQLAVWQADLRGVLFAAVNFTRANLTNTAFTADIDTGKVKFLPSGELLIAGSSKGELCLWRTVDGQLTAAFRRAVISRLPLIFSDDGDWLVVVDLDYTIQVWSTAQGVCAQTLVGHRSAIHTLAMSKDGTQLASGSIDGVVYLWEWRRGQIRQYLTGDQMGNGALAFSPGGNTLATGGGDGVIRLWDTQNSMTEGRLLATLQAHTHSVGALAFSPDGRWLASGGHGGNIRLWDLQSAEMPARRLQGHTNIIRNLCFQPSGSAGSPTGSAAATVGEPVEPLAPYLLASSSADRTVRLWSLTGELRYTLLGHMNEITALDFSADGRQLASSGVDQTIYWWDTRTGQMINSLQAYRYTPTTVVRFSPDGELAVSGSADHLVRLWPVVTSVTTVSTTESRHCSVLRGHTNFVRSVAVSPGGQMIASGSADHTIRLWDRTTHTELQRLTGHTGTILSLAFTRTSSTNTLLASASGDCSIRLWSINEAKPVVVSAPRLLLGHGAEVLTLAFDPTGHTLVSGDMNGNVWIWDVERGVTRLRLTGHTAAVTMAAISADGRTLATSAFDQTVRLWDLQTGDCFQVKKDEHVGTRAVLFLRQPGTDDELLAYDGDDFAIYLWPWRTGGQAYPLRGHSNAVLGLDVSPTAPLLISISQDGTGRLWDLTTRTCRQVLHAPGPYAGMKITGVTGISEAQKAALRALGAVEE